MSLLIISGIVGLSVGVFFLLISLFSPKEDYLLDDYSVEDAPDNVRIIEREIPKIIEKEVIKEIEKIVEIEVEKEVIVEKIIIDTTEIERLSGELNSVNGKKISIEKELEKIEKNSIEIERELSKKEGELKSMSSEFNTLNLEKREITDKYKASKKIEESSVREIDKLKEERQTIKSKLLEVEKNRKGYKDLFKKTKKELEDSKLEHDKIVSDRDHFSKIIEKKDVDIKRLKLDALKSSNKQPYIYEGVDEYGKFFDVYNDNLNIEPDKIQKIQEINENLDSDQFAYYSTNNSNKYENVHIGDMSDVEKFVNRVKDKETKGTYDIFIIFSNRVYPFKLH